VSAPAVNPGTARRAVRRTSQRLQSFHQRHPEVGPAVAVASVVYFVAQIFVAWVWKNPPYSLWTNTISDLGNTVCYGKHYPTVCSTRHDYMNAAFIFVGAVMVISAVLLYQEFNEEAHDGYWDRQQTAKLLGFALFGGGGIGAVLVGIFPENVNSAGHITGAALAIGVGNLGILLLAAGFEPEDDLPPRIRRFMAWWGVISLVALLMFAFKRHFGLGQGGLERIAAYPETIWLISFGLWVWHAHPKERRRRMRAAATSPRVARDGGAGGDQISRPNGAPAPAD
jgi:hypothetical membrane protein